MRGLEQEVGRGLALHLQQVVNINAINIIDIIPIIVIVIIYFSIIGNNPQSQFFLTPIHIKAIVISGFWPERQSS